MATKTDGRKNNRFVKKGENHHDPISEQVITKNMPMERKIDLVEASETPEEKIARLEATVAQQKEQLEKKGAMPGWLIITPNLFYNGITAGIKFKSGRGFISGRDENAEKKAKMLCDDFGYERRFVEDFLSDPDMAEEVGGSLTEILLGAKNR